MKVFVLNGPNLGRLDLRNSSIYGDMDFAGLSTFIADAAIRN
jgi:3-dehydroquinate dehydratase-2